ncbi:chitin synthase [Phycomyces blakesleeanus NRRL 1555(-)]|uniref:chitin synthase n=3 Tax=Phycomyces blakesleeanus TaxID=4837 RepID=A0A167Q194_PHYB8|nr:chitin synthase [Phycomyces blakesleeanus NRRL 1555(-)]OAD78894.1 chitin synthase [Phycomyces blakesleeanus NRRL 1555(-)]|eukprot:XP_018296934.1 chitin synthase [Phycomyces blakesleeanus NRRL 1555(-)]
MDSLAETTYSKKHKIFFVIADGMITGEGETRSTPEIVTGMMDLDPTMANPKPSSYLAIADGEKQLNMAKVYAGHYKNVPCIAIIKCGTEEEKDTPKAGNRGKRDSQLILMSYFQRVMFNDRLSELDYELFWKMTWLMKGVTPDKFELVLMVDADTKVLPDALTYMVAAMANDITIMGLCGETRIANKRASWVTAIQVFEYYISHHYAKAFESLFGIVTCLPGCFSMYRIKSPKNGAWVPILANPDIILEYNQNVVTTLHEKNLLLLGEDRFLTTLMLRTFPKRQMMFVPQARCKTVVPDEFKVLLSQRRRWINSTVHNLMELVLVSDLCGIACLSMQFSIFIDLIGTLVLPAAICMTIYLIINTSISSNPQWQSLALLLAILGMPAVLIAITTFKFIYVVWMCVYICALPIWNFVLPVYSFWHFDDFSWGATRVIAGEKKDKGHGDAEGKFDSARLVMKKWEDWESERTGQRVNKNKFALKTPHDPPAAFDGKNTVTPVTPGFGTIFNDRKMYGSSPSVNLS